jgi:hypothetical protein
MTRPRPKWLNVYSGGGDGQETRAIGMPGEPKPSQQDLVTDATRANWNASLGLPTSYGGSGNVVPPDDPALA